MTIALLGAAADAQQLATTVLEGTVVDPQGAVVKGAPVTARLSSTAVERSTATNNEGVFILNDLAPGAYEIRVQAPGFADFAASVSLEVGQQQRIKVELNVQANKITVNVSDLGTERVDTISSVVDGVVNAHQIDNLPLNGRNFLELALLMPGNTIAPNFDPTKQNTVVISSAGQLGRGGNVSIDGMDDNDDVVGGMLLNVPEDAVQEFQVATNRFSAELGRSGSTVVNVVTKAGTNSLHGSASIYERDKSLQALPFDASGGATPPFRRQQYAGTLGGPLTKEKAWWFGGFEYRNELGGLLVATRLPNVTGEGGTISNSYAPEPLTDPMGTLRADWKTSGKDTLTLHYNIERQDATGVTTFLADQSIGSASQRQDSNNRFQTFQASWTRVLSPTLLNRASYSFNNFHNAIEPVTPGPELDFPSLADGASYDSPQLTWQKRSQWDDEVDWTRGKHNLHFGGEFQRIGAAFDLGVFRSGAVEFVQDFADQDRNGDGATNDQDLLFAVAIRSGTPNKDLIIPNADNNHIAGYIQDDWRVHSQITLNLGLRYEIDTDVNDVGHYSQINPILLPFLHGTRHKDGSDWGPRIGFNWASKDGQYSVHGGYGIYYDRITLELESLERGLDGRALPINVTEGNVDFLDANGNFLPGAPTFSNSFSGPIIPGAGGASEGIDLIDNDIRNPRVQQFNLGIQTEFAKNWILKVDGIHDFGTRFILGVPLGSVYNPDSGGPETVTDLQSAAQTHYDALWVTVDHRFAQRFQFHSAYTFSKASDYANYDQIPFGYAPVDPTDLRREYGPAPNDQRQRLVMQGTVDLPLGLRFSPLWTYASGVPMDILLGDGSGDRVPELGRNAGGRQFHTGAQLNAFLTQLNNAKAPDSPFPMVSPDARFDDTFNSFDMRLAKDFRLSDRYKLLVIGEAFNLFNKTNILGTSKNNYSGFFNALVPDGNNPNYSSAFGTPVSQAGGVFGSGGPRAFQLAAKLTF
ncbi:MAG: carboxypeptidase regulatory-like domain-containing protein [Terriglobales bacterium]